MTNKMQLTSAPQVVVRQIQILVGTLLSVALFALALVIWNTYETEKVHDITSNYHSASIQNIDRIRDGIFTIKLNLKFLPDNLHTELNHKHDSNFLHEITSVVYLIGQNADSLYVTHNRYQHADFDKLISQLKDNLEPIVSLVDNKNLGIRDKLSVRKINTILLILDQVERLHTFNNIETLQREEKNTRTRLILLFLFLFIATLFIANFIKQTFTSIKTILVQQVDSQNKLKQEKELIHTTLLSIGDAVITTDKNGLVTNLNPVAEKLTGWSNTDAQGKTVKKIFPIFNANTREPIENPVEKVIQTGETVYLSNHTTLTSKDGSEYQIADSAAPILNNNEIMGMVLVFNDVTEQYQLREAASKSRRDVQAVMDNTPAVVYVKDLEGRFLYVNKKFETLFHIHHDDIINKTGHDIFPEDIANAYQINDNEVIVTQQTIEREEIAILDDGLHTYSSVKYPLFDEDGNLYAVCAISSDITKSKKQDEIIRRSQKMDALGKLVGGVAHDYNNMLGVILGYVSLLDSIPGNTAKQNKYISQIQHATERGTQLTKKLLSFSSHSPEETAALNINELINDTLSLLEKTLTPQITIKTNLEETLWPVWLDRNNLEDIILNLSINAMHAIDGIGTLTLQTANIAENNSDNKFLPFINKGDYVLLRITDTGCGMDDIVKEKIFDPFFTTKGDFGTGLGLSQVYGYVKQSGGVITVESKPGEGTQFNLYFPRHIKEKIRNITNYSSTRANFDGNENILIVDDEPILLELTSEIIGQHGYTTYCASNAHQAMSILEDKEIHLMLSDVIMPEIDGYELAAFVQEHYPSIKIQLASGYSDDRHLKSGHISLHKKLLNKPYAMNTVLQRIRELLDA